MAVTSTIGSDTELQVEPITRWTLFWWMKRLTLAMPLSGLHSSSSRMTSSFLPLMPPLALTASSSSFVIWPYLIPFSTIMRSVTPMRITPSCDSAGVARKPALSASAGATASALFTRRPITRLLHPSGMRSVLPMPRTRLAPTAIPALVGWAQALLPMPSFASTDERRYQKSTWFIHSDKAASANQPFPPVAETSNRAGCELCNF